MKKNFRLLFLLAAFTALALSACGSDNSSGSSDEVVIGYFPNIDHVPAMVAKEKKYFEDALGEDKTVTYKTFPDGGAFMTALKTGDIDAGFVGPGPVMNNYANGADVKIIAGASSGGTVVVASEQSGIESVDDIENSTFITPGVGCTHNVQMETSLKEQGITSARIGGTLKHVTGNPAQYQSMFESGKVDLAAVPEPWASTLVENGAKIIVDTDEIAYGKTLPNTVLVTSGKLLEEQNEMIQQIAEAHEKSIQFINENPEEAQTIAIDSIEDITNQRMDESIIASAWERVTFTSEVDSDVIQAFADSSYDLQFLNEQPELSDLVMTDSVKLTSAQQ
ncbi:aliphatic sulfonate ABC transporter substrate-binding protein [Jeotgalibacillus proteolyticus]|uniref:Aliphatic sulfonates ABC transporter substrate-binding protein n=1 Tax=Jeotgalibacillus proteolyticus TaxID=2082395 RepID=A0A2S5GAW9_9BACL|nr:aliphatic sulfonate ABC transporter substrate-binding protein [Jeotgalibacillus proteolyticus]PPA70146.1 aliphatic sulfonates ABC transporter substrate-binding protein [Jeotgalibacillus proteolyticus]